MPLTSMVINSLKSTIKTFCCVEYTGPLAKLSARLRNIIKQRPKSESCDSTNNAQIQHSKQDDAAHNNGTDQRYNTQEDEIERSMYT